MLSITTLPVGQLKANCYIVYNQNSKEALIIDPGDEPDFIAQKILSLNLNPLAILATHLHFDHVQATQELKLAFKIPFLASHEDGFLLSRMRKSALYFTKVDPGPAPKIDQYLTKGNFRVSAFKFKILEVPGHTPGSVCFYFKNKFEPANEALTTGSDNRKLRDWLTRRGPRRSDDRLSERKERPSRDFPPTKGFLFTGDFNEYHNKKDKSQVIKSINKIKKLPKETIIFPGHGEPTQVSKLRSQF